MPRGARIVTIGDLNGAADALREILQGTGVLSTRDRWIGGPTEIIQVGDIFNRGSGAREAFELLLRLRAEARRAGGRVTMLLGNHEAMTALGNEAYCTEEEYLSFATAAERRAWPAQVRRQMLLLLRRHPPHGPVLPLLPRLELWKATHVPGRAAMRRALRPGGKLGRALRKLPVTVRRGETLFVHGGVTPRWARLGVDGLNAAARELWSSSPRFIQALPRSSLARAKHGPLWDRTYPLGRETGIADELEQSLRLLGVKRMVVGHTPTEDIAGGQAGRIALRFGGRLVCVDVGIVEGSFAPRTALVIEGGTGLEWTPSGTNLLWGEREARA